jgi:hypothetical protein
MALPMPPTPASTEPPAQLLEIDANAIAYISPYHDCALVAGLAAGASVVFAPTAEDSGGSDDDDGAVTRSAWLYAAPCTQNESPSLPCAEADAAVT